MPELSLRAPPRRQVPDRPAFHVVIIGFGFSGAAAAIALMDRARTPLRLTMIDGDGGQGGGLAYGRAQAADLLNVRAGDLTVDQNRPGDFAEWLEETGYGGRDEVESAFKPRRLFVAYIRDRFSCYAGSNHLVRARHLPGWCIDIRARPSGGWTIDLGRGGQVNADAVILATGYGSAKARFGSSPHEPLAPAAVARAERIVLVGSGLTMADVLLRLRDQGHRGSITVISRHGLISQPHSASRTPYDAEPDIGGSRLNDLLHESRARIASAGAQGRPWQGEINRLRHSAQDIWRSLPDADRRRFLRHLRWLWDAHRHRLPPSQHDRLEAAFQDKSAVHRAGTVLSVRGRDPFHVDVRWRGAQEVETLEADLVIDCSGHRADLHQPVIRNLVARRLSRIDPYGLGLSVASDGRVLPTSRSSGGNTLFALGPLGQGSLFEITAAPEIVAQAALTADTVCAAALRRKMRIAQ